MSASPKQASEAVAGPLRVLVAEDNLVNQKVLQKVLQRVTPDSPIFIANNGQEALKVPSWFHPSLPSLPPGLAPYKCFLLARTCSPSVP